MNIFEINKNIHIETNLKYTIASPNYNSYTPSLSWNYLIDLEKYNNLLLLSKLQNIENTPNIMLGLNIKF